MHKKILTYRLFLKSFETGTSFIFNLLAVILLARTLGSSNYGLFVLANTIILFGSILTDFGTDQAIIRFIPKFKGTNENKKLLRVLSVSLYWKLLFTAIASILIYFFAETISIKIFSKPELAPLIKTGVLLIIGISLLSYIVLLFEGLQKWILDALINISNSGFYFIFILILFINNSATPLKALYMKIAGCFISIIIAIPFLIKIIRQISANKKDNIIENYSPKKDIFTFGFPLFIERLFIVMFLWSDRLILGALDTNSSVGCYSVAANIYYSFYILINIPHNVIYPYISENEKLIRNNIQKYYSILCKGFFYLLSPIAIILVLIARPLIVFVFGTNYISSVIPVQIFMLCVILNGMSMPLLIFLKTILNKPAIIVKAQFYSIVVNIILNIILIPKFSLIGAVSASAIAWFSQFIALTMYLSSNKFKHPWRIYLYNIIVIIIILFITIS